MIDLKIDAKKKLVPASGKRTRSHSIYKQNQKEDFKISRGKFSDFMSCRRCFYMDRVVGLDVPGTPGWSLNETTDLLLKKEFDKCRELQKPHRLFIDNGLNHLVPFQHEDMDKWRDSLHHGLMARFEDTNIILTGGVDDIWKNTENGRLVIADYKSQASKKPLIADSYLFGQFKINYKIQMDFYAYLLQNMGFEVDDTSYFLVCNADREADGFNGELKFQEVLIPYRYKSNWIHNMAKEMIRVMNDEYAPDAHESCKNCAYAAQIAIFDKQQGRQSMAEDGQE